MDQTAVTIDRNRRKKKNGPWGRSFFSYNNYSDQGGQEGVGLIGLLSAGGQGVKGLNACTLRLIRNTLGATYATPTAKPSLVSARRRDTVGVFSSLPVSCSLMAGITPRKM